MQSILTYSFNKEPLFISIDNTLISKLEINFIYKLNHTGNVVNTLFCILYPPFHFYFLFSWVNYT